MSDSAGAVYRVERYAGARGGLSIATPDGPASNSQAVLQSLTSNATSDMFQKVFAFSLDELQDTTSLNNASETIYSAGQGAPGLPALRKSLSDNRSQIYLSRGNIQKVPTLLKDLQAVDAQLRGIEGNAGRYGALTARKSEIDVELQDADAELGRLSSQRAEIENLLAGWEDWIALSGCETQLRDMPRYINFPDNPILRLESIEERIRQSRELCDEAAAQLRQAEEAASVEIPDENLLYDKDLIEVIRRARGSFDDSSQGFAGAQG